MTEPGNFLKLKVFRSRCGQLPVVLGCAPASQLCALSFADVLDETRDSGYQRPIDRKHSREFKAYIEQPGATTIPLTFNLRGTEGDHWSLTNNGEGVATLSIRLPSPEHAAVLAQVDCQHRLGMMQSSDVPLTFQCFLGLSAKEEMAVFSIINGKAKGLSTSLLDYHTTKLIDVDVLRVELYIAKELNDDPASVWHALVKLGGKSTQGSQRKISLRGLQSATKLLVHRCQLDVAKDIAPTDKYRIVRNYWAAVASTWPSAWKHPRNHLLAKGVGVSALSLLGGDIIARIFERGQTAAPETLAEYLAPLSDIDWSTHGSFKAFGGRKGASEIHNILSARIFAPRRVVRASST